MKLHRGKFRTRKAMKRTLGMRGLRGSGVYYRWPIVTDDHGNRYFDKIKRSNLISIAPA